MKSHIEHNQNFRSNERIMSVIAKYGLEGYGKYWCLAEIMFANADKSISFDSLPAIEYTLHTKDLKEFAEFCIGAGIFLTDGCKFWDNLIAPKKRGNVKIIKPEKALFDDYLPFTLDTQDLKSIYSRLTKDNKSICDFIKTHKPDFAEPYVDLWNLYAEKYGFSKVLGVSGKRMAGVRARLAQDLFDIEKVFEAIGESPFLHQETSKWFGFEWIFNSPNNFIKVLEGKYKSCATSPTSNQRNYTLTERDYF